ncbi:MAG: hypothetical protein ACI814_002077, partial [Mariniblastus sp.]
MGSHWELIDGIERPSDVVLRNLGTLELRFYVEIELLNRNSQYLAFSDGAS